MKILLLCVPYDSGKSGISVCIRHIVRELAVQGHELTLVLEASADGAPEFAGFEHVVLPAWTARPLFSMLYCLFLLPWRLPKGRWDRLIITAANRRMLLRKPCETYAIVHDLSQYHIPTKYDVFRMFYIRHVLPYCVRRVPDVVVAVSRSTANDLVRYWKIPRGKIMLDYNGVDKSSLPRDSNDASEKIVLYVSRIEAPGKNHANLIRAWELLPPEITKEYKLLLAGSDWSGSEAVHRQAEASPCAGSIEFGGFISSERLRDLYMHASLYVFPSFFEGFGLSLIEAMACGLVCACSNNSSLGEIAADAALTFDPAKPEEIAEAIRRGLTDAPLRAELRRKGLLRAEEFDWCLHAGKLAGQFVGFAEVFGIRFGTGTMDQALEEIDAMLKHPHPGGQPHFCAFANADCLNIAYKNTRYADDLNGADAVWADGVGIAISARLMHTPVHGNVNGTDMLPLLCRRGWSLYLFGAAPGVAEKARERLLAEFPMAKIAGVDHGFCRTPEEESAVIGRINAANPDILLVAMGVPKQEEWIVSHRAQLNCGIAVGVGGLFDFASGRIPRAPTWMRKLKIEWTYRLYNEPVRLFRRYVIGNPLFIWRVVLHGSQPRHRRGRHD